MVEARIVPLGKLVAGHGVRGLARVKPFNPRSPALEGCDSVWLSRPADGTRDRRRITQCRPHKGVFLMAFEGLDSLDALLPWIGSLVETEEHALPAPGEGELYHFEAVGLEVETTGGDPVGTVVEVMALPANDVWVVHAPARDGQPRREILIPAVAPIVIRIDLAGRRAVIDPIPGLLDA